MPLLYSSLFMHGFLPDTMIVTIIAPIIKDKSGDLSDNNNYIPIALATDAREQFESLILFRATPFRTTCANKCGFKSSTVLICSYWIFYVCYNVGCLQCL